MRKKRRERRNKTNISTFSQEKISKSHTLTEQLTVKLNLMILEARVCIEPLNPWSHDNPSQTFEDDVAEGAELENRNKENYYNPNEEVIFELEKPQECQSDGVLLNWRDQESYFWILTHYKQSEYFL